MRIEPGPPAALRDWNPETDIWSLYHVYKDFSEADDLAAAKPAKLAEMKSLFDRAARDNHVYPIGAGLIPLLYPDQRIGTTATEWTFTDLTRRLPEFAAPDLRARHSRAVVDLTVPAQANGVVYALGGRSGGVTLYFDHGKLTYEYNGLVVTTTTLHSDQPLRSEEQTSEEYTSEIQ